MNEINKIQQYREMVTRSLPGCTDLGKIVEALSNKLKICEPAEACPLHASLHSWLREPVPTQVESRLLLVIGQSRSRVREIRDNREGGDNRLTVAGTSDGIGAALALAELARQNWVPRALKLDGGLDEWEQTYEYIDKSHVMVVGTGDVNIYSAFLCGMVHGMQFGDGGCLGPNFHTHYRRITINGNTYNRYGQLDNNNERHFGLIALMINPWNPDFLLMWVAGLSGIATHSGCRLVATCWADYPVKARNAVAVLYEGNKHQPATPITWLLRRIGGSQPLWVPETVADGR